MKRLAHVLVLACLVALSMPMAAQAEPTSFGFASVSAALSTSQAGAHPDFETTFEVTTDPESESNVFGLKRPYATTRNLEFVLPPGLTGNPNAVSQCTVAQFQSWQFADGGCPNGSQIGVTKVYAYGLTQAFVEPVYVLTPPGDDRAVARLGFIAGIYPTFIEVGIRDQSDYGITARLEGAAATQRLVKAETTLWGVPAASAHDTERQTPAEAFKGATSSSARPPELAPAPFLTNPTSCSGPLQVGFVVASYEQPGQPAAESAPLPEMTGCEKLRFEPTLSIAPTIRSAASPTGLDAELRIPQDEAVGSLATAQLRDSVVALPTGFTVNPPAAGGLVACDENQAAYGRAGPAQCPEAAKIGTAEFEIPALEHPLHGAIYQRTPELGRLFRIWLVADELGVHAKIPGDVEVDPATGQLTAVFPETPQVPVEGLKLHFREGARAPLATPHSCGTYGAHYRLEPWSGTTDAANQLPIAVDGSCETEGFAASLRAGSTSPQAGSFSPFVFKLTLPDAQQNLSRLEVRLPRGVLARLAGVTPCPDAAASFGSCPATAQVGWLAVAAGLGASPLWMPQPGKSPTAVYLAGPYDGAPYSLVVVVPAQAGPFDLGTVVTRAGIHVDPETAEVTVKSDPLPQILEGVPVVYRALGMSIDRAGFMLNPTGCGTSSVSATALSTAGETALAAARYAAAGCRELTFRPTLSLSLTGGTRRTGHPALKALLTSPVKGQSNLAAAKVLLPPGEQIDNAHVQNPCTRVQFNAEACPRASILGTATAVTPLLDQPLSGPVYFRSNGGARALPDIVADLKGQIHVALVGFIDSVKAKDGSVRIRSRFLSVPDAPVSKFVLRLDGGRKGLLINSSNLCKGHAPRARTELTAQNGSVLRASRPVKIRCRVLS